jgi:hypothetical protein
MMAMKQNRSKTFGVGVEDDKCNGKCIDGEKPPGQVDGKGGSRRDVAVIGCWIVGPRYFFSNSK